MLTWDSNIPAILRRLQRTNYPRMAQTGAEFIAAAARKRAPVRTGALRASIGVQPISAYRVRRRGRGEHVSLQMVVGARYAPFVEGRKTRGNRKGRRFIRRSVLAVKRQQRMLRRMGRTLFEGLPHA